MSEEKIEWKPSSSTRFFQRYDGPYINENIELGNHPLRKIVERHFEYMSRNLYFISAFGRYLLGFEREDEVAQAEDIARRTIENAIASIRRRIEQAETVLRDSGISDSTLYGKRQAIKLPITTPGAKLFATLLTQTDHYYSLNSLLWFNGEIDNHHRFANESAARRELLGVIRGVSSQFMFILKKTQSKDAKEAARAGDLTEAQETQLAADAESSVSEELGVKSMIGNMADGDEATGDAASDTSTNKPRVRKIKKAATEEAGAAA